MVLTEHPFGNNYYTTEKCGGAPYDSDVRHCWATTCLTDSPPDDCFNGDIVPQHGDEEAKVNRMEACASALASDWQEYWTFLVCMETKYNDQGLNATASCTDNYDALQACYDGDDGDLALVNEAKATFDHSGVPYLVVNGEYIANTDDALAAICAAYNGTDVPTACKTLLLGN